MSDEFFGPEPERDKVTLTDGEQDRFLDLAAGYGEWADPATEMRQHFAVTKDMPGMEHLADGPGVGLGLGLSNPKDARDAIRRAREAAGVNVQSTLSANNAWMGLQKDLDGAVRDARRITITLFVLAFIAGAAIGIGLLGLLQAVIG